MKRAPLAIFGAPPRFSAPLHVGRPNIGDRAAFLRRTEGALDRHWLSNDGELVAEFEQRLTEYLGVRHCLPVSSGTMALTLAIRALGLSGEVIVPAFTFIASAHVLAWHGLTPVFCDVDPRTHSIDPAHAASLITPRTTGIMAVHLWGEPCDVSALATLARDHGLRLLFDAAHAFGSAHGGRMIGNFGDAEAFSFHATKVFNTFEGGAIATNDDRLAADLRSLRNFGFTGSEFPSGLGTNGKLHEISAAMGLTNLESLSDFVACNRRNYLAYARELAGVPGIRLVPHTLDEHRNHSYVVLEVEHESGVPTRDQLVSALRAENVLARRYYWPGCHRVEPYRSDPRYAALQLPVTDAVAARAFALPTGTGVSEQDIAEICDMVRTAMTLGEELRHVAVA